MLPPEIAALREAIGPIALRAGHAILSIPLVKADAAAKDDGSPVTRADRASHEIIVSSLATLAPRFPIVSEEGDVESARQEASSTYWLVDPLDGTKEFLKGLGEYTVNIALIMNGDPVLGVVYAPPLDRLYDAAQGLGARKTEKGVVTLLSSSSREHAACAVVSRSHLTEQTERFLFRLAVRDVIHRGSSLKFCAVAEGAADLYPRFGPTCLWDTAAGTAVARETGCHVVDLAGQPLRYELAAGLKHSGFLVCATESILEESLAAISRLSE